MAKYRALTTSYHNNQIVEPGDIVDIEGEVGSNFEPAERKPSKTPAPESVPADVASLINAVRLHAATRGVPPTDVNELDFDEVVKVQVPPPSADTVKAAADKLGVKLGASVA